MNNEGYDHDVYETRVNIVNLDIPYFELLKFCFKFIFAWIPAVLLVWLIFFAVTFSCSGLATSLLK